MLAQPAAPRVRKAAALVWLLVALLALFATFQARRWSDLGYFQYDPGGYVAPLHSLMIVGEPGRADSLEALQRRFRPGEPVHIGRVDVAGGRVITKYPIGLALLNAPWYGLAHLYTRLQGEYPADGYSRPYQRAIAVAGIFYGLLGLWLLAQLLKSWFSDGVTAWAIAAVGLGTNLFNYMTYEGAIAHSALFMWQVSLLTATVRWYRTGRTRDVIAIGFFLGIATLTRPTELLFGLVPLLWGLHDKPSLTARWNWLRARWPSLLGALGVLLAVVGLQLGYWKWTTGHWFLYSYGNERFDFTDPHLLQGLFSFRKGWLLYTPLMGVALLGIGWLRRYVAAALAPVLVVVPTVLYVTFCWWQWWYGGSFSCRPAISLYPLLALSLASLLTWAHQRPRRSGTVRGVVVVGILLNLLQTWQYHRGILHWDSNTASEYVRRFFEV